MDKLPSLHEYLDFWIHVLKWRNGQKINTTSLQCIAKQFGHPDLFLLTMEVANEQYIQAKMEYQEYKKYQMDLQGKWLEKLAQDHAAHSDFTKAHNLMQLKHQEQQRNDARLIKAVTKPAHKCSLVQVIGPALLNDPTRMEFD